MGFAAYIECGCSFIRQPDPFVKVYIKQTLKKCLVCDVCECQEHCDVQTFVKKRIEGEPTCGNGLRRISSQRLSSSVSDG